MPEDRVVPYNNRAETDNPRPELSPEPIDKKPLIIGAIVALLIIIIFAVLGTLSFNFPEQTAILRDIFIIFMGLGIFVIILLLIALIVIVVYLILKVNDLVQLLDREIKPVLSKLQQTVNTVSGTATFLSEQAIQPVITMVSTVTAVKTIIRSLFRRN